MAVFNYQNVKNSKYANKIFTSNFVLAFVINLIFLLLVLMFCDMKYEVSDDFVMASILSGAYGDTPNPHMIFVNILLGYLLIPLYTIFPEISWYFVTQILLIFLSSISIAWLLLEKTYKPIAVMLSVLLILFFTEDAYILVQFTKTAMFAVLSGSLIFIDALFNEYSTKKLIGGALLCLSGTLYRFSVIYLAGGFLIYILTYESISLFYGEKDYLVFKTKLLKAALCGSVLIAVALGFEYANRQAYLLDEDYRYFCEYNTARAGVVDSADYGYEAYASELADIGVSKTDYYMMKSWNFADNDVFTLEKMQQAANIIKNYHNNQAISKEYILDNLISRKITSYPIFIICLLTFFLGLFFNYKSWWTMLPSIGIGFALLLYFCWRERNVYRIEFAIFLAIFVCGIYFWDNRNQTASSTFFDETKYSKICGIVVFVFLAGNILLYIPDRSYKDIVSENRINYINDTFNASWNYNEQKYRKVVNKDKPSSGLLDEIRANVDNFYFLDFNTTIQSLYYEWNPWKTCNDGEYENYLYLS